ncbi:MAG: hypothetical protein ABI912_11580 [Actinomycetota bacterium]
MAWSWKYDLAESTTTGGFPSQAEAEAWVAESWQQLYDAGARAVTLLDGDRLVYTMSLDPA